MVLLDAKELAEKVGGGYELEGTSVRIAKGNSKLNCKIDSIILPLLADHVLREANHYIRLLESVDTY